MLLLYFIIATPIWDLNIFWVVDFFEGNSNYKNLTKFDDHQTSPYLEINFLDGLTESVRLFDGNSTSKTLTKFDDHQTSPYLGLKIFLDGLTKSVTPFLKEILLPMLQ